MQTVRIIAAIVDTRELTLYRADGETIKIPQGDPRIRPLVQLVVPEIKRLQEINRIRTFQKRTDLVPVYVELTHEQLNNAPTFENTQTHYAEAEKKMGGVAKFFRIAKSKLKELVDKVKGVEPEPVEPTGLVGSLHVEPTFVAEAEPEEDHQSPLTKSMDVVNEIIAHAVPSHSDQFAAGAKDTEQTIVAVLEDGTIIPDMENLDLQLRHTAEKLGNPVGIIKFFERVSKVERGHSVKDLLKFMEKGELPIADDGSILVYKRLKSTNEEGVFVDCHSGKVKQRVGSHVFMDEALVDPNRSRDCSNGLHVARRDYLSSFSGDVTVLAKLAPEDVIAVPHSDARKLRAKGYFIIARLSKDDAHNVCANRKLTDTNLLGNAVAGNHTPIIETVQITEQYGGGLVITPIGGVGEFISDVALSATPLKTEEDVLQENSNVDARTVGLALSKPNQTLLTTDEVKDNIKAKYEAKAPVQGLSKVQQLVKDFEEATTPQSKLATAQALVAHKKSVKKSWTALGVSVTVADQATTRATAPVTASEAVKVTKPSSKKPAEKAKPSAGTKETKAPVKAKAPAKKKATGTRDTFAAKGTPPVKAPAKGKVPNPLAGSKLDVKPLVSPLKKPVMPAVKKTKAEEAGDLWNKAMGGGATGKKAAQELLDFKKKAKKGWEALGLSADAGDDLLKLVK